MEKSNDLLIEQIDSENIKIIENLDLNSLFNLSYNFELLKGVISTILSNQQSLQKQIENSKKINDEQNNIIESLKSEIKNLQEDYVPKEEFIPIKEEVKNIDNKLKIFEEELTKSK